MTQSVFLSDMSWPEVQDRLKQTNIAIIPTGSIEQHGPHLPLKTDILIASEISQRAAERVKDDVKAVITPPIPFGYSPGHSAFPGSIWLESGTFINIVKDVCKSLLHHGFKKIIFFNGHGNNPPFLLTGINDTYLSQKDPNIFLIVINWGELISDVMTEVSETAFWHACEVETSLLLALNVPINMKLAKKEYPQSPMPNYIFYDSIKKSTSKQKINIIGPRVKDYSKSGILGDPTKATREKGEIMLTAVVDRFATFLKELHSIKTWFP